MTTHLDYYREHNISPVTYTQEGHFERRASLLRQLRVLPQCFRGAMVLEVGPGSGQNAAYIASLSPSDMTLIEPNDRAARDCFNDHRLQKARILQRSFQDVKLADLYDIAICENWLGCSDDDKAMIRKLAGYVALGGILMMTVISETGLQANGIRRAIAERLLLEGASYEENVARLVEAFGPHLATIKDMTRTPEDWVKDNMLNPAWQGIGLTLPMLIDIIGNEFNILGTSPDFIEDWRWFKSLHGDAREYNQHALEECKRKEYLFQDYNYFPNGARPVHILPAFQEAQMFLGYEKLEPKDIANMQNFKHLFGRETIHVSFTKR